MKEKIILIGGGGHCKACIDVIEAENKYKIAGIVDKKERINENVLGYKIIASDDDLTNLTSYYNNFFITIGQIKNSRTRLEKYNHLKKFNANLPIIISPIAYVSHSAIINEGTIIMHNAIVNADALIGKNCIISTGAIVEHDVIIGNNCHISTNSTVNGGCKIGDEVFLGSNTTIIQNLSIKSGSIIGAASVMIKSIDKKGTYCGNPAKRMK